MTNTVSALPAHGHKNPKRGDQPYSLSLFLFLFLFLFHTDRVCACEKCGKDDSRVTR